MKKWLTIVGLGEEGFDGLSASAKHALYSADVVVGSDRLQASLPPIKAKLIQWPQPFSKLSSQISTFRDSPTVILATGDPMNFGVARKVMEFVPFEEITILPHLSAFSLAAVRLGWSIPDCDCLTIHGRPAANLEPFIQPDARLLVLTQDETSVEETCQRLKQRGFESSIVTVLENMGGDRESVSTFAASQPPNRSWSPLNTIAIHCKAGPNARILSRLPGLPDDVFQHDGKITKREIRATTLAKLSPAPDQLLWDLGAGSGSIGIEWMRSARGCEAIAIEIEHGRCSTIVANAEALGTPRLKVINGAAPNALEGLPPPHAVFIGGGIDQRHVFERAWKALRPGGHLVANTVTLEGDTRVVQLQNEYGGDLVRIDSSTLIKVGTFRAMRPRMSVLQWHLTKAWA